MTQVTRNESWTPTAFHANVVAMDRGEMTIEEVASDYVNCTQCGACELRCPNTLFTGDFYRFRTRTVDVVKAVRAFAVESGVHQPAWQSWNERTDERTHEPVLGETPVSQEHVRDWSDGLDLPIGGETVLFVDCEAAFYRTSVPRAVAQILQLAGYEFGLMGEQWCCGGPAAEMGYVDQAKRFAQHNLDNWRSTGTRRVLVLDPHDYISFTEDYPKYFGADFDIEVVLVVELFAELIREGRLTPSVPIERADHLPRPVPAQQAQGHLEGAARDPALDPRPGLHRRRPGDPVVLLLRRRGRPAGREARAHGRDLGRPAREGGSPRGGHAGQRLSLVRAAARRGGRGGRASTWSTSTSCWPSRSGSRSAAHATDPAGQPGMTIAVERLDEVVDRPAHGAAATSRSSPPSRTATTGRGSRRRSRCTAGPSGCPTSRCCPPAPRRSRASSGSPTTCACPSSRATAAPASPTAPCRCAAASSSTSSG